MRDNFYSASLGRTQGRNTWAVNFRHPKRTDPTPGTESLRVRQSLKTDNDQEAATLRDPINRLLASPQLWDLDAREQALGLFDPRVADIFHYKLEGGETDCLALRDGVIALPSSQSSDYRRALFLGTTGAGKTTLLRQLMGTDPLEVRFPSPSAAKTTVHETEVILQEGPYCAVVTFFPMEDVREHLKECACAAVLAAYRSDIDAERGGLLKRTNDVMSSALASVKAIAARYGESLRTELNATDEKDQRVIDELFEEELDNRTRDDEAFQRVIDAVMDEIEERFALLPDGKLRDGSR